MQRPLLRERKSFFSLGQPKSLPAVKITGAAFDSSSTSTTVVNGPVQQQFLPKRDPSEEERESKDSCPTPGPAPVEVAAGLNEVSGVESLVVAGGDETKDDVAFACAADLNAEDDGDFLDLLVDTFDGDFDPDLYL